MTEDPIDIRRQMLDLCRTINLEPEFVTHMVITPSELTATVLKKNENGRGYIDPDTNKAAAETHTFKVRT